MAISVETLALAKKALKEASPNTEKIDKIVEEYLKKNEIVKTATVDQVKQFLDIT